MARRIVHIITGLTRGGAETMLYRLLSRVDRGRFESSVVCLKEEGPMTERIRALGIPVHSLNLRARLLDAPGLLRLRGLLKTVRPDLVQTWLYHADLLGGLATKLTGSIPVVWGIRMSRLEPPGIKRSTILAARVCARLSRRLPARIVCCSESGLRTHAAIGYDATKMTVIPNGFDVESFCPDPRARESVRSELGITPSAPVAGLVARFHPQKDHAGFLRAALRLAGRIPDSSFLLAGHGIDWKNSMLRDAIESAGHRDRFRLIGPRDDVARLCAAFDVAVSSSSYGEGFPNAVGEAMACGVPCVVTDVGDSAWVVGDTGRVVPPRDSEALAAAVGELLSMSPGERKELGKVARRRIVEHFELSSVVHRYEQLYLELTSDVRH